MTYFKSELFPIGRIGVRSLDGRITEISVTQETQDAPDDAVLDALSQLHEYFDGKRKNFELDILYTSGTDFQRKVWDALREIPYGETVSYSDIAKKAGNPKAVRAAATAVGKNPLLIVNPCHRVIRADGKIGNFACGEEMKKKLILLELSFKS